MRGHRRSCFRNGVDCLYREFEESNLKWTWLSLHDSMKEWNLKISPCCFPSLRSRWMGICSLTLSENTWENCCRTMAEHFYREFEEFNLQWTWLSLHNVLKNLIFVLMGALNFLTLIVLVLVHCRTMRHIPEKNLHVSTPTWWLESRFHFRYGVSYGQVFTDLIFVVSQEATTIGRSESRLSVVEFRWGLLIFFTW